MGGRSGILFWWRLGTCSGGSLRRETVAGQELTIWTTDSV